jgi:hypothetical protein
VLVPVPPPDRIPQMDYEKSNALPIQLTMRGRRALTTRVTPIERPAPGGGSAGSTPLLTASQGVSGVGFEVAGMIVPPGIGVPRASARPAVLAKLASQVDRTTALHFSGRQWAPLFQLTSASEVTGSDLPKYRKRSWHVDVQALALTTSSSRSNRPASIRIDSARVHRTSR